MPWKCFKVYHPMEYSGVMVIFLATKMTSAKMGLRMVQGRGRGAKNILMDPIHVKKVYSPRVF